MVTLRRKVVLELSTINTSEAHLIQFRKRKRLNFKISGRLFATRDLRIIILNNWRFDEIPAIKIPVNFQLNLTPKMHA